MIRPLKTYFNIIANNTYRKDFELTIFVTNYCNESCEHCFYASELNTKKPEFDVAAFRKIAATIPPYCRKVIFAGGEPFLRNDLFQIVSVFKDAGVREFGIVTNGTLTDKIMKFVDLMHTFKDVRFYVQVSIDGPQALHDKIRHHDGAYRRAMETLRFLKEKNVNTGVQTAISKTNFQAIRAYDQAIYDELKLDVHYQFVRGAEVSGLSAEHRNGFDPLDKTLLPTNEQIAQYLGVLRDVYTARINQKGKLFKYAFSYTVLECKYVIGVKRTNIFPCIAGEKRGVIYPTGETAVCEYFKPVQKKIQEIDYDFGKIWESSEIREQDKIARNCHCTHGCYINIIGTYRFFFYFLRNIFRFLFKIGNNPSKN